MKKRDSQASQKRALNKNPDEFYHHMLNSKTEDGMHFEKETEPEDTTDQLQLMRTQDLKYIVTKRSQESKKIEKLQALLHLNSVDVQNKNNHIYFDKAKKKEAEERNLSLLMERELPIIDEGTLVESAKKRKAMYKELAKRIERERELAIVQQKLETVRAVESRKTILPPKKVKKGTKERAPIYVWKYDRKK